MSLKAGRVGVNPNDVDPVSGHISPDATDSYTKAQADDKFLSKSDASSTYESKSEASTAHNLLQPKTLAVPISMLDGTKLTVETALQGLNNDKENVAAWVDVKNSLQALKGAFDASMKYAYKYGKILILQVKLAGVTADAYEPIFRLNNHRLKLYTLAMGKIAGGSFTGIDCSDSTDGIKFACTSALNNNDVITYNIVLMLA